MAVIYKNHIKSLTLCLRGIYSNCFPVNYLQASQYIRSYESYDQVFFTVLYNKNTVLWGHLRGRRWNNIFETDKLNFHWLRIESWTVSRSVTWVLWRISWPLEKFSSYFITKSNHDFDELRSPEVWISNKLHHSIWTRIWALAAMTVQSGKISPAPLPSFSLFYIIYLYNFI